MRDRPVLEWALLVAVLPLVRRGREQIFSEED